MFMFSAKLRLFESALPDKIRPPLQLRVHLSKSSSGTLQLGSFLGLICGLPGLD